jgi:hypothetical protein
MSTRTRLLIAAAVLLVGAVVAVALPSARCPDGGQLDAKAGGGYWCHVSDVGYSASSLVALKIGIAVMAVVIAGILVLSAWRTMTSSRQPA